jgi:hypothetical protein
MFLKKPCSLSLDADRAPQLKASVRQLSMYDDDYPTCKATYATLRIYRDELEPDIVSSRLGLTPSQSQTKGQVLGRNRFAPVGGWFLSSKNQVTSKDVRRHIAWILDKMAGREVQLLELQNEGYETDISCYWLSASGHGGPELDPDLMQRLASLRLPIDFDVY